VLLSQISDELKPYQGSEMDYIKDTILYSNIDRANYDQYFKMCAEGFATMVQLNTTIVKLNEGELSKDDEFVKATLVFAARRMAGLEAELKRIEALDKTLDPENDFKGIEKRKQPGAIKGLVRSRW